MAQMFRPRIQIDFLIKTYDFDLGLFEVDPHFGHPRTVVPGDVSDIAKQHLTKLAIVFDDKGTPAVKNTIGKLAAIPQQGRSQRRHTEQHQGFKRIGPAKQ